MAAVYYCSGRKRGVCDYESPIRWTGRCPLEHGGCGRWYDILVKGSSEDGGPSKTSLAHLAVQEVKRISTGMPFVDEVLGGGMVAGSSIVISGPAGTGKSTLLLKVCDNVAQGKVMATYASGEQSMSDVGLIAARIGANNANVDVLGLEGNVYKIAEHCEEKKSKVLIIDSINTAFLDDSESAEGSAQQIKDCTNFLTAWCKREGVCLWLIGHIKGDGSLAGPKTLEHLVDTVLELDPSTQLDEDGDELEETKNWIALSSGKNRNGPSNVTRFFEMTAKGVVPVEGKKKKSRLVLVPPPTGK